MSSGALYLPSFKRLPEATFRLPGIEAYQLSANTEKNKTEVKKYKNELRERIIKGNKYRAQIDGRHKILSEGLF